MQGAIAAGICGAGNRYLGTMQSAGEMLLTAMKSHDEPMDKPALEKLATAVVEQNRAQRRQIPGLGHPEHKSGDPRTPKLLEIARQTDTAGRHCELLMAIGDVFAQITGKRLPVNAAGLSGAIIVDMGLQPEAARGLAVISRAAGLVGIVLSEMRSPTAQGIWDGLR
jgi:citrate synthase